MMLMARSQDLTPGVLAIEQLAATMTPRKTSNMPATDTEASQQLQSKLDQAKLGLNDKKTTLRHLNDTAAEPGKKYRRSA
jgi:hypothetical protein